MTAAKNVSSPKICVAFGPNNSWVIAVDAVPAKGHRPYYAASDNIPAGLKAHLFSNNPGIQRIHSVALGENDAYFVCYTLTTGHGDFHKGGLSATYPDLKKYLLDKHVVGVQETVRVSIGSTGHVWFATSKAGSDYKAPPTIPDSIPSFNHLISDPNDLADTVAFGVDTLAIHHGKRLQVHGCCQQNYPDLKHEHQDHKDEDVDFLALNSFTANEYFMAYSSGTICKKIHILHQGGELPSSLTQAGKAFTTLVERWRKLKGTSGVVDPGDTVPGTGYLVPPPLKPGPTPGPASICPPSNQQNEVW